MVPKVSAEIDKQESNMKQINSVLIILSFQYTTAVPTDEWRRIIK